MNRLELAEFFRNLATTLEGEDYVDYIQVGYEAEAYIKVMKRGNVEDDSQVPTPQNKHVKVEKEISKVSIREVTSTLDAAKGRQVFVTEDGNAEVVVNKGGNK